MFEQEVPESTVKENVFMSPFIADVHKTMFTANKGIGSIETTVEDLHKALAYVEILLDALPDVLDAEYFNKFKAFPALQVISMYGTTYRYTEHIISNVSTVINENEKKYTSPPSNVWTRGPAKAAKQVEQNSQL
eukprot:14697037-Ditylum_brightwellii.AAC.1